MGRRISEFGFRKDYFVFPLLGGGSRSGSIRILISSIDRSLWLMFHEMSKENRASVETVTSRGRDIGHLFHFLDAMSHLMIS